MGTRTGGALGVVRILHVINKISARYGGITTAIIQILRMLRGSEAVSSLVVGGVTAEDTPVLRELGLLAAKVWAFPQEHIHPFGFSRSFTGQIRPMVECHDVIHIHSMWNWPSFYAAKEARAFCIPLVFSAHGALDHFDVRKHALLKRLLGPVFLRPLFEPPTIFLCTARRESENLVTYGGKGIREVIPLPVAADPALNSISRKAARCRLGISADAKVVLFLSRINYKKGLEVLVPALAEVKRSVPELVFILAGDGEAESKQSLAVLMQQHATAAWTRLLGFVQGDAKAEALAASDLFALPSMNENFGFSLVEALAAGIPVIISPGVYICDDLRSSEAVTVCERNVGDLATAVKAFFGEHFKPGRLAEESRDIWRRSYSPENLVTHYLDLYQRAVALSRS